MSVDLESKPFPLKIVQFFVKHPHKRNNHPLAYAHPVFEQYQFSYTSRYLLYRIQGKVPDYVKQSPSLCQNHSELSTTAKSKVDEKLIPQALQSYSLQVFLDPVPVPCEEQHLQTPSPIYQQALLPQK